MALARGARLGAARRRPGGKAAGARAPPAPRGGVAAAAAAADGAEAEAGDAEEKQLPPRALEENARLSESLDREGHQFSADLRRRIREQIIIARGPDPWPREFQQTIRTTFVCRGVGLNSGKKETVRIRPARAGEGRYFVKVQDGHIDGGEVAYEQLDKQDLRDQEEYEDFMLESFRLSLMDEEERAEYLGEEYKQPRDPRVSKRPKPDEPIDGVPGEVRIPATLENVASTKFLSTWLGDGGDNTVKLVEHLLAALEALGVDNCRIEVEGTGELPILDGSSERWAMTIAAAELVPALDSNGEQMPRLTFRPTEAFTVRGEGTSFISFHPEEETRLTVGIDKTEKSRAIGKQWFSWTPTEDAHYTDAVAPARTYMTELDLREAISRGLFKGHHNGIGLIGDMDSYINPPLKFYPDECARHQLGDMIGDLSLMAPPGGSGLPVGHIMAYKADHALHIEFAKQLQERCEGQELVPSRVPELFPYNAEFWQPKREAQGMKILKETSPFSDTLRPVRFTSLHPDQM